MSPYREPPPVHKPAPKAPWYRVAWAILTRRLLGRLELRDFRLMRGWCPPVPPPELWPWFDRRRQPWNFGNMPPMPLPGPAKNVSQ